MPLLSSRRRRAQWYLILAILVNALLSLILLHWNDGGAALLEEPWRHNSRPQQLAPPPVSRGRAATSATRTATTTRRSRAATPPSSHHNATQPEEKHPPVATFDILSIGSRQRLELLDAQQRTFGSHRAVRHFWGVTEDDDTSDPQCHERLQVSQVRSICRYCRRRRYARDKDFRTRHAHWIRLTENYANFQWLKKKANPVGWMCAQKRPVNGLHRLLRREYQNNATTTTDNGSPLPDYLVITDDDTWLRMDLFSQHIQNQYPSNVPLAVAGCMVRSKPAVHNFTMPFGGFGLVLTRAALQNLVRPIHCPSASTSSQLVVRNNKENVVVDHHSNNDEFTRRACATIAQNHIGEQALFRNGMAIIDLMQAYATDQSYLQVDDWYHNETYGYCLHSDWASGYWINFYPIVLHRSDHKGQQENMGDDDVASFASVPHDRLRSYRGSTILARNKSPAAKARLGECRNNHNDERPCAPESHICHYVQPHDMENLHRTIVANKKGTAEK